MKVILGSSSPRRKDILKLFFENFHIIVPEVDEIFHSYEKPVEFACRITRKKMEDITNKLNTIPPYIIITSDTIVTIDDKILGKPTDYADAINMINSLSGKTHEVISSLCLHICNKNNEMFEITDFERTKVTFKKLSIDEIEKYLHSTEYMDKAGSYAIQENGDMIVEKYEGSLSNVIGFPVRLFLTMLDDNGMINLI